MEKFMERFIPHEGFEDRGGSIITIEKKAKTSKRSEP